MSVDSIRVNEQHMKEAVRNVQDYATFSRFVIENQFRGSAGSGFCILESVHHGFYYSIFYSLIFLNKKLKRERFRVSIFLKFLKQQSPEVI